MKMHPSVTTSRIIEAVKESTFGLDNTGICIECGSDQEGCEPDARKYVCEACGEKAVYGAAELLLMTQA